jgi:uncharacterized membrane protein
MGSSGNVDEHSSEETRVFRRFFTLFFIGFLTVFLGIIILTFAALFYGEGSMNFGALIFIGPIPIVVGAGPEATLMVLIAVILAVLSVILFIIMRREVKRSP